MSALTEIWEICLTNAAVATALGLAVAGVGLVWRRPALLHLLWVLVLAKLLAPPVLRVPILLPAARAAPPVEQTMAPSAADVLPIAQPSAMEELVVVDGPAAGEPAQGLTSQAPAFGSVPDWPTVALAVWVGGAAVLVGLAGWRVQVFRRLLRHGRPAPADLVVRVGQLARGLGLSRCPDVWLVPGALAPFVWAVGGRARLVLPAQLLTLLDVDARDAIVVHELAHLRRRDHWVRWLEFAAVTVYWWHPVAWLARREIQRLEEECCDGWVVWALPAAARAYARALLETIDFVADVRPVLPPVASGFGYVRSLKRRLHMVLRQPSAYRLSWPACLGAALVGLLALTLTPQRVGAEDPEEAEAPAAAAEPAAPPTPPVPPVPPAPPAPPSAERSDLDRRMDALERKMEHVIRALERRGRGGPAGPGAASGADQKTEADADKARQKAEEARAKARQKAEEVRARARERSEQARWRAREMADAARQQHARTAERDKEIHRQIEVNIRQAINPERMKQLEREIEETVRKTVDPERMEVISRQIEEAVHKAVNPQRLEALGRQIEEAVSRALRAEAKAGGPRHEAARAAPAARHAPDSHGRDLERRMERLERRLDRVLEALEKDQKSPGTP